MADGRQSAAARHEVNASTTTRLLISDLCKLLETYMDPEQVREVYRAYLLGAEAHADQKRLSGEPYIYHPIAVACTLAEMRMDPKAIVAAILHDVIEDTPIAKTTLAETFGDEVAELVDGVSKLSHLEFANRDEAHAANFQKMMLAIVKDFRVILVKLADRLHNMRTLGVMPPERRRRIARETVELYAPIAQRLGMNTMRRELDHLGFAALYPWRYRVLCAAVERLRRRNKELVSKVEATICARLEAAGIEARIHGREKNLYSLYKKMRDKHMHFQRVNDIFGFRIQVKDVDTCYRVLGIMHNSYKPVPGRFKDYIAIPKSNGYQSLHTVLFGPHGITMEVQIRTEEMEHTAESGIAAHWRYKGVSEGVTKIRMHEWTQSIMELQQSASTSIEFLENVKADLFPDEVYVFTPQGDIMELPSGATPVDFAYAVHSELGDHCGECRIDYAPAPLSTTLESGQTVEIIRSPFGRPEPHWLNFVVTAKARSSIRSRLKRLKHEEAEQLGRRMVEKALLNQGYSLADLQPENITRVLEFLKVEPLSKLFTEVGLGNRAPQLLAYKLIHGIADSESPTGTRKPFSIKGTEGMVVDYANCCQPIPGDPIVGLMSADRGLVVHRETCPNIHKRRGHHNKSLIYMSWTRDTTGLFNVGIRLQAQNKPGVLGAIAGNIGAAGANIEKIASEEGGDSEITILRINLSVRNRAHLADIMRSLRKVPVVLKVTRSRG